MSTMQEVPRRHWVRTFWSTVLIVIACALAPLSVVSVWARGEVTDTTRYVQTVAPLADDPAIQQAVADRITQEIFTYVNVPGLTSQAVATRSGNRDPTPEQTAALQTLPGPLNSGVASSASAVTLGSSCPCSWTTASSAFWSNSQRTCRGAY